jgi:hypothetical protein
MVGGTLLAGMAALVRPAPVEAAAEQSDRGDQLVADAIDKLRSEIVKAQECGLGPCSPIATIRTQQNNFLKANQKFPDFIDVGVDVWQGVYDWHVKNAQPINATRLPDGRYGLAYMFTTLVLRPDHTPNAVSFGYDAR